MGAVGGGGCGMESVCSALLMVVFLFRGIGELLPGTERISRVVSQLTVAN